MGICNPFQFNPPYGKPSHKIEIVQVLAVPHNIPLDLTAIHPSDEVLHIPRHQESRIRNDLASNPYMSPFDERNSLHPKSAYHPNPLSSQRHGEKRKEKKRKEKTHSLNSLHHPRPNHNNRQPPPTKSRNSNLLLNLRQPRPLFS